MFASSGGVTTPSRGLPDPGVPCKPMFYGAFYFSVMTTERQALRRAGGEDLGYVRWCYGISSEAGLCQVLWRTAVISGGSLKGGTTNGRTNRNPLLKGRDAGGLLGSGTARAKDGHTAGVAVTARPLTAHFTMPISKRRPKRQEMWVCHER